MDIFRLTHAWNAAWARAATEHESGQTMAEYATVLTVITMAVVVTIGLLAVGITGGLTRVIGVL